MASSDDAQGYSLSQLGSETQVMGKNNQMKKNDLTESFQRPKIKKDGTPSKVKEVPPVEELHVRSSLLLMFGWIFME